MGQFFRDQAARFGGEAATAAVPDGAGPEGADLEDDLVCEEALLEAFSPGARTQ